MVKNEKYNLKNVIIDIDNFYYEIVNDNVLSVNIDVSIDKIEIINLPDNKIKPVIEEKEVMEDKRCLDEEVVSIFENIDETYESYTSYTVCIVREGDSLESIMEKNNVSKEKLEEYNNLEEIKLGNKIIIPC